MKKKKLLKGLIIGLAAIGCFFVGAVFGAVAIETSYSADLKELEQLRDFRDAWNNATKILENSETTDTDVNNGETDTNTDTGTAIENLPQTWGDGMYKVGVDIPAGEYVLITDIYGHGYFAINSDSSGDSILNNDNFATNAIVTVIDGQYLELSGCLAYKLGEEPTLDTTDEGTFKVGVHISAGEYKIHSDGSGYVEVGTSSAADYEIVTNDNFEGDSYITVSDGQYLKLSGAHIVR